MGHLLVKGLYSVGRITGTNVQLGVWEDRPARVQSSRESQRRPGEGSDRSGLQGGAHHPFLHGPITDFVTGRGARPHQP